MSIAGQPWMKFYPADWRADPALRVCSVGARGAWMEMLCIMHEAEPRGSLLVGGKNVSDAQLAVLIGVSRKILAALICELEQANVFSRDDDGTIYSRRIRRDVAKAERDKANGKAGGNPSLKLGVKPPVKAQKPEARSQRKNISSLRSDMCADIPNRAAEAAATEVRVDKDDVSTSPSVSLTDTKRTAKPPKKRRHAYPADAFAIWYEKFPKKQARPAAEHAFRKIEAADDTPFEMLLAGIAAFWRVEDRLQFWPQPGTWLNNRRWLDEPIASPQTPTARPDGERFISFGGGVNWPEIQVREAIKRWRGKPSTWPEGALGPPPGSPGCKVPTDLLMAAA